MDGNVILDFREAVRHPNDAVPAFVPLDDETVAYLRSRLGPIKRESYDNHMTLDEYPSSGDWAF